MGCLGKHKTYSEYVEARANKVTFYRKSRVELCPNCGSSFTAFGKKRFCSTDCRHKFNVMAQKSKREVAKQTGRLFGKPIVEYYYKRYERGAVSRGLGFNLSLNDFKTFWQQPCYYCGDPIDDIGLDRMDSERGYSLDNVVPCCTECNYMKRKMSAEFFIEQCTKIANIAKSKVAV